MLRTYFSCKENWIDILSISLSLVTSPMHVVCCHSLYFYGKWDMCERYMVQKSRYCQKSSYYHSDLQLVRVE